MIQNLSRRTSIVNITGLLILSALSVAIRLPFFSVPMTTDEGSYAYVAHFWSGSYQLYRDIPFDRPQGIFVVYKIILRFFGGNVSSIRFAAAIFNTFTLMALFFLAQSIVSEKTGWIAASLFALFSAVPSIEAFTANAELFAALPLVLSSLFTWKRRWFLAGSFAGVAFLIKPIGLSGIILAFAWILLNKLKLKSYLQLILGFSIGPFISLLHGISIGIRSFMYAILTQKLHSDTSLSMGLGDQIASFWQSLVKVSPALGILYVFAFLGFLKSDKKIRLFGALWLISSILGMALGGNWYWHYYVQIIPPLAFLGGNALSSLSQLKRPAVWITLLACALLTFSYHELPYWFSTPQAITLNLYQRPPYVFDSQISGYIRTHSNSADSIYVAFSQPEVYYLSRRKAAVPNQMFYYQLKSSPRMMDLVLQAVRLKKPKVVIWTNFHPIWMSREEFLTELEKFYREVRRFPFNIRIYEAN